jgi:hypothetical protein
MMCRKSILRSPSGESESAKASLDSPAMAAMVAQLMHTVSKEGTATSPSVSQRIMSEMCLSAAQLCSNSNCAASFVSGGGIASALFCLNSPSLKLKTGGALVTRALLETENHHEEIVEKGLIPLLVSNMTTENGELKKLIVECICEVAVVEGTSAVLVHEGAIEPLCGLLPSIDNVFPDKEVLSNASVALAFASAHGGKEVQDRVLAAGGIAQLVALVDNDDSQICEDALFAVTKVVEGNEQCKIEAIDNGAIEAVIDVLKGADATLVNLKNGSALLAELVLISEEVQADTVKSGIVPVLSSKLVEVIKGGDIEQAAPYIASAMVSVVLMRSVEMQSEVAGYLQSALQLASSEGLEELSQELLDQIQILEMAVKERELTDNQEKSQQ